MNKRIFISVAAYKDPELVNTLRDCVNNAKHPENLRFSVCWQFDERDSFNEEFRNSLKNKEFGKITVLEVPYHKSKGTCWARSQIQQQYSGEGYSLQLDSHHRFVKDWDVKCIDMVKKLQKKGFKKPLLTAYVPEYDPDNDPAGRAKEPWQLSFDRFIPEGAVFFLPCSIHDHKSRTTPVRARFFSAHFVFTLGKWVEEVPYDPNYFFHGEEISLAARSYTHGYDLFHPHEIICYHEYTRKNRTKYWDDHTDQLKVEKKTEKNWVERNNDCHLRNRKLFEMDGYENDIDFGSYGFGTERSLADYEEYAGISFSKRGVQQYTLDNEEPPNPVIEDKDEYENSFSSIFKHFVDVQKESLPDKDYDCLVVAFEDKEGKEIYRQDADENEIKNLWSKSDTDGVGHLAILRQFQTATIPYKIIVWPHSKSKGWTDRQEHLVPHCVS